MPFVDDPAIVDREQWNQRLMMSSCLSPAFPHMRSVQTRMQSFEIAFALHEMVGSPSDFAEAGFFYVSNNIEIRCWYCSGSLVNWDPFEKPWVIHARFFPDCQFLLQRKGISFVRQVHEIDNSRRRRINQIMEPIANLLGQRYQNTLYSTYDSQDIEEMQEPAIVVTDPMTENSKKHTLVLKLQNNMNTMRDSLIEITEEPNFDSYYAARCIVDRFGDEANTKLNKILEEQSPKIVLNSLIAICDGINFCKNNQNKCDDHKECEPRTFIQQDLDNNTNEDVPLSAAISSDQKVTKSTEVESELDEVQVNLDTLQLKKLLEKTQQSLAETKKSLEDRKCKVCLDNNSNVVFDPCGHLAVCNNCVPALNKCPICRAKVTKAIKAYMS